MPISTASIKQIMEVALSFQGVNLELNNTFQLIDFQQKMETYLGNLINKKKINEHQANSIQRSIRYTIKKAD